MHFLPPPPRLERVEAPTWSEPGQKIEQTIWGLSLSFPHFMVQLQSACCATKPRGVLFPFVSFDAKFYDVTEYVIRWRHEVSRQVERVVKECLRTRPFTSAVGGGGLIRNMPGNFLLVSLSLSVLSSEREHNLENCCRLHAFCTLIGQFKPPVTLQQQTVCFCLSGRVHAKSPAHGKIADSWMFFEFSQTRIAIRSPWRLNGMQKLRGFVDMVFL